MFDINLYNQLLSIAAASAALESKLASSGIALDTLLEKLRPLFCSDEHKGKYGLWLLHHHFDLDEGERMVKNGAVSQPTQDKSSNIVAERWTGTGDEVEHVYADSLGLNEVPSPPPQDAYNIDCLGICSAPSDEELKMFNAGCMFVESCKQGRKQILTAVSMGDLSLDGDSVFRTTWSLSSDWRLNCSHSCTVDSGH
ncbi:hypothetical protein CVT26_006103 [Gymnopilus dilepis]|uniref:Uncharacterized protein n=1 Tax=Gymnopilus dilepis TaxID=231916 RepID=A0A409YKH1_9AGAR|nr:hypothetical protein CVT26_006103 [Gymnopilus dilepis]